MEPGEPARVIVCADTHVLTAPVGQPSVIADVDKKISLAVGESIGIFSIPYGVRV